MAASHASWWRAHATRIFHARIAITPETIVFPMRSGRTAPDPKTDPRGAWCCLGALLLSSWSFPASGLAAEPPSPPAVPFTATAIATVSRVRLRPDSRSPELGLLREGDVVTVTGCVPDCGAKDAWALLGALGSVKLSLLRWGAEAPSAPVRYPADALQYGRTEGIGSRVYKHPDLDSVLLSRLPMPREMAFLPDPELRAKGWLERLEGGFVRARWVSPLIPSTFRGEVNPRLPLAFVLTELGQKKAGTIVDRIHRYDRLGVQGVDGSVVTTDKGTLPRSAVRVISVRSVPHAVPLDARWIAVDLTEQTLTAYEGSRPVFATLVSTGRGPVKDQTRLGLFEIQHKLLFSNMNGAPDEPYAVDRVPYTIYFDKGEALHGAYWHDRFGAPMSHGCVNLSLADAKWLFDWSPPSLPAGWSEIDPQMARIPSLWVLVVQGETPAGAAGKSAGNATYSRVPVLRKGPRNP